MLELSLLIVTSVVYQNVVQPRQQHEPGCNVDYVLTGLIEMPIETSWYQQSNRETSLQDTRQGQQRGECHRLIHPMFVGISSNLFINEDCLLQSQNQAPTYYIIDKQVKIGNLLLLEQQNIEFSRMSGTGEKRQLKQLMSNLHEMIRFLGEDDGSNLIIKIDEFEMLRRDFVKSSQQYEKSSDLLPNTSDKKERGILIYKISSNRSVMDRSLNQMMDLCMKLNQKIKSAQHKKKAEADSEKGKLENELQYKNLTVYQLQSVYFKLTKKEHKDVSNNENYPDQQTLQQLQLKKPLRRGFSETSDPNSIQHIKQKQLLEAIKYIDARIQQKMDYILDGLRTINYNAVTISESIGVVHNKILINVQHIDENLDKLEQAEKLLDEAAPLVSKPNCIMNLIIVILLGVLVFFIIKVFVSTSGSNVIT